MFLIFFHLYYLLFNLNYINWVNICLESEKSLLVEICAYWKKHNNINNEGLTTKDLIKIFNLARITVIKYLKKDSGANEYRKNKSKHKVCISLHIKEKC